ncbi:MAG: L-threonylcarbamoyladenylate synthase [Candidatus Marinimicrobia bacterium]|nr:L-threonylcarbamoyladenylate synthase [Candidatus Neomarinimicrobiota bacterium]
MELQKINWDDPSAIKKTLSVLGDGGVIVYPTDTIYGFGGDATSETVIKNINLIKGRSSPMSVLAPSVKVALTWLNIPNEELPSISNVLGGKTTVIVPIHKNIVHESILGPGRTLGIRIPDHPYCKAISKEFSNPIITTSVNRSGEVPISQPADVVSHFGQEIDLFINDGILSGSASKIYIYQKGMLKILRS